ncbi:MAG: cytochrome c [Pseudomonadales bacterium]|nr:cytochrome c [Halieaceae bacterium]MCP5164106.1 cytochrome c [Pseudomonadales bacterium]MCP5189697.1 cytochrome c [Pseudomonadales bacterium]MCP5203818.1 cytochrome c [Pseudomonadales bacterium]
MTDRLTLAAIALWLLGGWHLVQAADDDLQSRILLGEQTFGDNCSKCHQLDGYGEGGLYPSLHQQSLLTDKTVLIQTIIHGRLAPEQVPGAQPQRLMPALGFLSDREIAALVAYLSNSWGDEVIVVTEEEVQTARQGIP